MSAVETEVPAATGVGALAANVRSVWSNRDLRLVQLAFVGSVIGDWASGVALMVWAYDVGGAALAGGWFASRALMMAVAAPFGGALADRMSRRHFMLFNDAVRCVLVALTALGITLSAPIGVVLVLGILTGIVGGSFRPAQAGLIPQLARTPRELTASNATAEVVESVAGFAGPALGAVLLLWFPVEVVVGVNAVSFLWSMSMVRGVTDVPREAQHDEDDDGGSFLTESVAGFRILGGDRDLLAFSGLIVLNGVLAGALGVLTVVIAAEVLGSSGRVGFLDTVLGVGALLGSVLILAVADRAPMGRLIMVGVLGWCVPLMLIGGASWVGVVFAVMFVIGVCDPLVNVGFATIPQRLVDERVMSRVFAALESMFVASAAAGAAIAPVLVHTWSLRTAALLLGGVGAALALLFGLRMGHLDSRLTAPAQLPLVRSVPLFATLRPDVQEHLAAKLREVTAVAGDVVVTEGEDSDLFYVIGSGRVVVTQGDRTLREEGPGEYFGEIGLLRETTRTATVTAAEDTTLYALAGQDFVEALSGETSALLAAEDVVRRRLDV